MLSRIKIMMLGCLLAAAAGADVACPSLPLFTGSDSPAGSFVPVAPKGSILLSLDNQSGLPAVVEASFLVGGQQVRATTRLLSATGPEAHANIFRTTADEVVVSARIASPVDSQTSKYLGGFLLNQGRYIRGVDYDDQGSVDFVIPPPPPDCNSSGVPDSAEIAQGVSRDCDGNTVPDECEPGLPSIQQCAGNMVVSADATGHAFVPNLTSMLIAIDSCTPASGFTLTQNVSVGTELTLDLPTAVKLTVIDGDGNAAECQSTITMIDDMPPVLGCPMELVVLADEACQAQIPSLQGSIDASDNTTAKTELAYTQSVPAGQMVSVLGQVPVLVQIADKSGNMSECTVTLDVRQDPSTVISDCSESTPPPGRR